MKKINSLENRLIALMLTIIMVLGMFPAGVFAANDSTLTTDIGEKAFVVGETTEFTFTTIANGDAGTYVLGTFQFSDPSAVEKLEYLEVQSGNWYEFYGDFGPVGTGFPLTDATSRFRVSFNKAGEYTVTAAMVTAEDRTELCSVTETVSVSRANPSVLTTNIGEVPFVAGKTAEFTFKTTANADAGTYVLGTFQFSDPSAVEKLEYLEVQSGNWYEFYGDFGPAGTGFPMTDATSRFRVTFNKVGTYSVIASMVTADNRTVLCSTAQDVTVSKDVSTLTTDIGEKTFVIGKSAAFTFTTTANADAGTYVFGTFEFSDPSAVEKLEYLEVQSGNWYEFYGDFGPAGTGFPMTNATSQFRVTFNKIGTYTVKASMVTADNRTELCAVEKTVTVADTAKLTTNIDQITFVNGQATEFVFATTANGDAGTYVLGTFTFSDPDAVEKLEYLEVQSGNWYEFYGDFGPAGTGFPLTDATSRFRVTFKKTGTYTLDAAMKTVADGTVLCSTQSAVTVQAAEQENFGFECAQPIDQWVGKTYQNIATGGSTNEKIQYTILEGPATITDDGTVTFTGLGKVTVQATRPGDTYYKDAIATYVVTAVKNEWEPFGFAISNPTITYKPNLSYPNNTYPNEVTGLDNSVTFAIVDGGVLVMQTDVAKIDPATGKLTIFKAGEVTVRATRAEDSLYHEATSEYVLTVNKAAQSDFAFVDQPVSMIWQESWGPLNLTGRLGEGNVTWDISNGKDTVATIDPSTGKITILKTGSFTVTAQNAGDDCYEESAVIEATILVTPATQSKFGFTNEKITVTYNDDGNKYTQEAKNSLSENAVIYKLEGDAAEIDPITGEVTILKSGTVTITATSPADDRYAEATASYELVILKDEQSFTFNHSKAIAEKYGLLSFATQITSTALNSGLVTYAVSGDAIGAKVDNAGLVTFANSDLKIGTITVTVTMVEDDCYKPFTDSYTITLSYEDEPAAPYALHGDKIISGSDWFTGNVTILAANGYQISYGNDLTDNQWNNSVIWSTDGEANAWSNGNAPVVYLKNSTTGAITDAISVPDLKRDTQNPYDLEISYAEPIGKVILKTLTFGIYQVNELEITVSAKDDTSKISSLIYNYDGTDHIVGADELDVDGSYTFKIPAQYRNSVKLTAVDNAGWRTELADNMVIVLDTEDPTMQPAYAVAQGVATKWENDIFYAQNDVTVTFTITESNADLSGLELLDENGKKTEMPVLTVNGEAKEVTNWSFNEEKKELIGSYTLVGEGDYVLELTYKDPSGNEMAPYEKEIHIDGTKPVITIVNDRDGGNNNGLYFKDNRTVTVQIVEHNFDATKVSATVTANNLLSKVEAEVIAAIDAELKNPANWKKVDDTYQAQVTFATDAKYTLEVNCADIVGNEAEVCNAADFVVDHIAPSNLKIDYSTPITTWKNILETITFGAYNPEKNAPLIVTLTATDITAGVDYFEWFYTREADASVSNAASGSAEKANRLYVTNLLDEDPSVSSVSFELEPEARGYISFRAADAAGNISDADGNSGNQDWEVDSNRINIVDTIDPERTVSYTPDRVVDNATMLDVTQWNESSDVTLYYSKDAVATFQITETNFYKEDVQVYVNGEAATLDKEDWTPGEADNIWTNTLTIQNEGDYVIEMTYTDRSSNEMKKYTSQRIVIDKTAPVVKVKYANTDVKNTIEERKYLVEKQVATITITDHNFRADDVVIKVTAKDILGNDVAAGDYAAQGTNHASWTGYEKDLQWRRVDDTYVATLEYAADANYTFDIEYQDLATNEAADYKQDLFTVDTTAPENLTVNYSTSVLEQIKESLSFGYYNAKMTVTITAEDDTAGIYHFAYSYIKGADVSGVNAELLDQAIAEAKITYEGKKATATFEIPKLVLGNDNQFNGTVEFVAFDRGELSTELKDSKTIVVDNIAPTANISYNTPVQTANGVSYYDGNINATITVNEANFDAADVKVTVTKGGANYPVNVSWRDNNVDVHTGTFTLTEDGDYIVSVEYTDKSQNKMQSYQSNQLTLDATMPVIEVSNIKVNSANKDEKYSFVITVNDTNLNASTLVPVLKAVVQKEDGIYATKDIDLGEPVAVVNGKTYTYTVEDLPEDGLYTLSCSVQDMSANTMSQVVLDDGNSYEQVQFSINRNGSVFAYGNAFSEALIGKYYIYSVDEDVVIVEVNVDPIEDYKITLNGEELTEGEDYTTEQTSNAGEWSKRTYTIKKALFAAEGEYNIIVSSVDKAETTAYSDVKNLTLAFVVDQTKPVLTITGMEAGGRYQTDVQTVTVIPSDEGGRLNSLKVVILDADGEPLKDEAGADISVRFELSGEELLNYLEANDGKITFTIPEGLNNQVKIICNDCAVNAEGLTNEYNELFTRVTVSQNQFVIFYANTPLFVGTIVGVLAIAGLIIFLIKRKKDKKTAAKA